MSSTNSNAGSNHTPMTPAASARIQSAAASANGGRVASGSFAARAQSAAAHNAAGRGGNSGHGRGK